MRLLRSQSWSRHSGNQENGPWMWLSSFLGLQSILCRVSEVATWSNSTEYNPCLETDGLSVGQWIDHFLCNPKVHYRAHKRQSLIYILSQINQFHTNIPYFLKIYFLSYLSVGSPSALVLPIFPIQSSPLSHAQYFLSTLIWSPYWHMATSKPEFRAVFENEHFRILCCTALWNASLPNITVSCILEDHYCKECMQSTI
jgi:hypothetical protein